MVQKIKIREKTEKADMVVQKTKRIEKTEIAENAENRDRGI